MVTLSHKSCDRVTLQHTTVSIFQKVRVADNPEVGGGCIFHTLIVTWHFNNYLPFQRWQNYLIEHTLSVWIAMSMGPLHWQKAHSTSWVESQNCPRDAMMSANYKHAFKCRFKISATVTNFLLSFLTKLHGISEGKAHMICMCWIRHGNSFMPTPYMHMVEQSSRILSCHSQNSRSFIE